MLSAVGNDSVEDEVEPKDPMVIGPIHSEPQKSALTANKVDVDCSLPAGQP
jgi:hypothetical protein